MDKQINLMNLLKIFLKRWWYIVLAMVISAVIAGVGTATLITPMYTSYGTLYTENTTDMFNQNVTEVNLSTVMVRKELVATYAEILSSNTFLQNVAKEVDLGYSGGDILGMISMTDKNETEILVISVTTPNSNHSLVIAQKIMELAPDFINEVVEGGSVKILDKPMFSNSPSSPNIVRNIEVGAIIGILISVVIVLAVEMFDNKVKDAETVAETFKYPILGEIPYFTTANKKDSKKRSKKTKSVNSSQTDFNQTT